MSSITIPTTVGVTLSTYKRPRIRRRRNSSRLTCFGIFFGMLLLLLLASFPVIQSAASSNRSSRSKTFYDTLGVAKDCSPGQIKQAYRKLALQTHPDKGGDEEEFKKVSKAYEVLSDPEQRNLYDSFGEAGLGGAAAASGAGQNPGNNPFFGGTTFQFGGGGGGGGPGGAFSFSQNADGSSNIDLSEVLRHMMGGSGSTSDFFQQQHQQRQQQQQSSSPKSSVPKTYTRKVTCTLEELATGATKRLKVKFDKGKHEKLYTIRLKPGWKKGTKVTFQAVIGKLPTMIFVVEEAPHKLFRRDGNDLHYTFWVSPQEAKYGGIEVSVPLPTGEVFSHRLPKRKSENDKAILASGKKMVISGKGMPIKGGPECGSLIIEFRVRGGTKESSSA